MRASSHRFATALLLALPLAVACHGAGAPDSPPDAAEPGMAAPLNASPQATLPAPAPAPAKPEVEPRSEWRIDESVETPEELAGREILAKFQKDDGRTVIIYRQPNGDVYRRISGAFGAYTRVEEAKIEIDD